MPLFSVVICTWNRCDLVAGAIDSVLAQTLDDFEVVVVDDGSTDDTPAVVTAVDDARVRYVRRENGGLSAARNTGARAARGEYLVFLDDDDRALPEWLAALRRGVGPEVAVVSCGCDYVDAAGVFIARVSPGPLGPAFDGFTGLFLAGTFAVRRDIYDEVGGYAEGLACSHQTELGLRLASLCTGRGLRMTAVEEVGLSILFRDSRARERNEPERLLGCTRLLLERHRDRLARDRPMFADFHAIAGVCAARLDDRHGARVHLAAAARAGWYRPRHVARLVLACLPPLARRVWRPPRARGDAASDPSVAPMVGGPR